VKNRRTLAQIRALSARRKLRQKTAKEKKRSEIAIERAYGFHKINFKALQKQLPKLEALKGRLYIITREKKDEDDMF
jgi:hypothetical protein